MTRHSLQSKRQVTALSKGSPAYLRLYEVLKGEIINGIYRFGDKFPSKRVLADRYNISIITAAHSLELLIDEGYLEARPRSGYYVTFNPGDIYQAGSALCSRSSGIKTLVGNETRKQDTSADTGFPFSQYARIMRRVISDYDIRLLERVPGQGTMQLRQALSGYLARSRGMRAEPERIVIGAGSEYLYSLIVQLFGRDVIYAIEDPSYIKIEKVYRAQGAGLRLLKLGDDGILSSELSELDASVLHISPYRSFPSGITTSASKKREYLRWANSKNAFIVEDDFESEFTLSTKAEETVFSLAENDNVIYLNSFTKTISPSTRISYMILPYRLMPEFTEKLGFYACTVPAFDQYVLAEFIASGEFERHINRVRRRLRSRQ